MCGIVGKYYFDERYFNSTDLSKMKEAISHRGPDSSGSFQDGKVALGFQRLSIIDTASGHQPLYNEDKDIVLLANGEIYNYKDLTAILISKGHRFRTRSDCEVIVHLYEEFGPLFIEKLNGMFAFCLYDIKKQALIIARDRVGIKPMYFSENDKVIVFGSEIKGILAAQEVGAAEEENVLGEYLCFRYLANRRTFFSGIKSLDPGTYIELTKEGRKFVTYAKTTIDYSSCSEKELIEKLNASLNHSVGRQMMTDVPLGTQLSGGVDSSLVSALASKYHPGLKTFTVGFHEASYDETPFAKLLAEKAGLEYHEVKIDCRMFSDALPQVIWFHDEPLCHANSVQMYLLCKYARQHVKVMLTGEGADELFAGYPRYIIVRIGDIYKNFNPIIAKPFKTFFGHIPLRKMKKMADNLGLDRKDLLLWNSVFASQSKVCRLMRSGEIDLSHRINLLNNIWNDNLSVFENLLMYERKSYLLPILMRQDKMSMAASIESRVPVLDNEMLEMADCIPYFYKIRNFIPKNIFKKVAAKHIPERIVYKKKIGFSVPVDEWMRDRYGLGKYLDMIMDMSRGFHQIDRGELERLVSEHRTNARDHGDILWPMINYAIWKNEFIN